MLKIWLLSFIFLVGFKVSSLAQFNDTIPAKKEYQGIFGAQFSATSFFYNEEYNKTTAEGQTFLGFHLDPIIYYQPSYKTIIQACVHLRQMGNRQDKFYVLPTLRFHYYFNDQYSLVLGQIYGSNYHQLDERLYDVNLYFYNKIENGIQFLVKSNNFSSDTWLNWRSFIFDNDPFQEVFDIGSHNIFTWKLKNTTFQFPLIIFLTHKGGEIDTSPLPVLTTMNYMAGADISQNYNNTKLTAKVNYFYYSALSNPSSGANHIPVDNGQGWLMGMVWKSKSWIVDLEYWTATDFMSLSGNSILTNYSIEKQYLTDKVKVASAKISWQNKIDTSLRGSFYSKFYYDFTHQELSFAIGTSMQLDTKIVFK